jgi:hypothetical protein
LVVQRVFRAAAPPVLDLAVGADEPPVRGDFVHLTLPVADVRDRPGTFQALRHRLTRPVQAGAEEVQLDDVRQVFLRLHDLLGIDAGEWCVVLVDAVHGDAIGRRARRIRQRASPGDVRVVQQAGPIDRAEDDRLTRAEEDQTDCLERIVVADHRLDPAAAQRMTLRRRDVKPKRSKGQVVPALLFRRTGACAGHRHRAGCRQRLLQKRSAS